MKFFLALLLTCLAFTGFAAERVQQDILRHVVILKFKSDAAPEKIKEVETAFIGLRKKIQQVQSLEWGTNVSKEDRAKGFTHCFFLTFKTQDDLDTYSSHADHKAFVAILKPVLDDVFVIDYWTKN